MKAYKLLLITFYLMFLYLNSDAQGLLAGKKQKAAPLSDFVVLPYSSKGMFGFDKDAK